MTRWDITLHDARDPDEPPIRLSQDTWGLLLRSARAHGGPHQTDSFAPFESKAFAGALTIALTKPAAAQPANPRLPAYLQPAAQAPDLTPHAELVRAVIALFNRGNGVRADRVTAKELRAKVM